MKTLLISILCFATINIVFLIAMCFLFHWIAMGEPDSNGDPERDAGIETTE